MKKVFFPIALIIAFNLVSLSIGAVPTREDYSIIINLSGKQRMLSQKMIKEALLIFAELDIEKNRENLKESAELFIKTLNGLRDGDDTLGLPPAQTPHIKAQIDTVDVLFKEIDFIFKRIIAGERPSRDAVLELVEKSTFILENMNTAVEMFEQEARSILAGDIAFLGIEINLSGKERMLTQKMAKEALLIYLDIDRRRNKRLLLETYTLFEKTLYGLKYGDGELGLPGTKEKNITFQLDGVIEIWNKLKPIMEKSCDVMIDKISEEDIFEMSELNVLLLDEMNKAVEMYEALAR